MFNPLTLKLAGVALIGILIAGGIQQLRIYRLQSQLASAQATNANLQADISIISDANATCSLHIDRQNEAVKAWQAAQAQREVEAAKRIAAAEKKAAEGQAKARALSKREMPVPNNACASLEFLLDEMIAERK